MTQRIKGRFIYCRRPLRGMEPRKGATKDAEKPPRAEYDWDPSPEYLEMVARLEKYRARPGVTPAQVMRWWTRELQKVPRWVVDRP